MEENTEGFVTHWCKTCGGVAHPATGCAYTPTFIVCYRCTLEMIAYVVQMTNSKGRRKGRPAFYDHVGVIAPMIEVEATDDAA